MLCYWFCSLEPYVLTKNHKKEYRKPACYENQKLELATQLSQRDSIINEWVLAFNEIESDIKKITARENMLSMQSMNPEISKDKKEEILKEIQLIREMIDQNKKKIASLNTQLHNSGIQIASLQARIDTLDAQYCTNAIRIWQPEDWNWLTGILKSDSLMRKLIP